MALISPSMTVAVEEINVVCYIMYMVNMSRMSLHSFILLFKTTCCLCLRTVVLLKSENLTAYNPSNCSYFLNNCHVIVFVIYYR